MPAVNDARLIMEPTLRDLMTQQLGMNRHFCPVPAIIMAVKHEDYIKAVSAMDDETFVEAYRNYEMFLPLLMVTGLIAKYSQTAKDKGTEYQDIYFTPPALAACRTPEERQAARALQTRRTDGDLRQMIVEDCADLRGLVNERMAANCDHKAFQVVFDMVFKNREVVDSFKVTGEEEINALSDWDLLDQWGTACFAASLTQMVFKPENDEEPELDAQDDESMERKPR